MTEYVGKAFLNHKMIQKLILNLKLYLFSSILCEIYRYIAITKQRLQSQIFENVKKITDFT